MDAVHGISYPDSLLNDLPVLDAVGEPIRALSVTQFAELHLQHTLAHTPDNVLFPFLHGLEGDNHAQNTFFASSSSSSSASAQGHGSSFHPSHHKIAPRIPKHRGFVWVVCEDDLEKAGDDITLSVLRRKPLHEGINGDNLRVPSSSSSSSDDESDSSFEDDDMEEDYEEDEGLLMMMGDDSASPESLTLVPNIAGFGIITDLAIRPNSNSDPEGSIHSKFPLPAPKQMDVDSNARACTLDKEIDSATQSPTFLGSSSTLKEKDDLHYEGRHMHPISPRTPPVHSAPVTLSYSHPQFQHPPHGLGINITIPSFPQPSSSYTSASSSSASTSTSTPCSSGSTPNSSIFAPDVSCPDALVSSPTIASLQDNNYSIPASDHSEEDNSPSTPCANSPVPHVRDLEQSSRRSTRSFPSIKSSRYQKVCLDPRKPPLLSSTFRPKELIRRVPPSRKKDIDQREIGNLHRGLVLHPFCPSSGMVKDELKEHRSDGKKPTLKDGEEEGSWEFVPAKVPDGISLRNFGIQVPIYATLSDIVVYSPYGATPAALVVARRFRESINAKRIERMRNAGVDVDLLNEPDDGDDAATSIQETQQSSPSALVFGEGDSTKTHTNPDYLGAHTQISIPAASKADLKAKAREAASEFAQYRVFVLDANEREMREKIPHLMMKIYGEGEVSGSLRSGGMTPFVSDGHESEQTHMSVRPEKSKTPQATEPGHGCIAADPGAHTDGPDGHIVELGIVEAEDERRKKEQEEKRDVGMDLDMVEGMDLEAEVDMAMEVDSLPLPSRTQEMEKREEEEELPNTVDFTLREKEEMRDLTKASAIISLLPESHSSSTSILSFGPKEPVIAEDDIVIPSVVSPTVISNPRFDPRIGEVYLGNSGDVPLAPPGVLTFFKHAASVPRDVDRQADAKWDLRNLTAHLQAVEGLAKMYGVDEETEGEDGADLQRENLSQDDPFDYLDTNDPAKGFGFDICIECHDIAPFPTAAHLRSAEEHLGMLDIMWRERWDAAWYAKEEKRIKKEQVTLNSDNASPPQTRMTSPPPAPPRPPPHANAVIHLPFPSSPPNSQATMVALMPVLRFLEKWIAPLPSLPKSLSNTETKNGVPNVNLELKMGTVNVSANNASSGTNGSGGIGTGSRRWSSVSSLLPSFPSFSVGGASNRDQRPQQHCAGISANATSAPPSGPPSFPLPPHPSSRTRSHTSPPVQYPPSHHSPPTPLQSRTRPLKILLYSSDGYTESSLPALCLLMSIKGLGLPEAYLELQIEKKRSFFVYQSDLGTLKRVEGRLREDRDRERERERERERLAVGGAYANGLSGSSINANGKRTASTPIASASRAGVQWASSNLNNSPGATRPASGSGSSYVGRPAAKSISFANPPPACSMLSVGLPKVSESLPLTPPFAQVAHSNNHDPMQQQLGNNKHGSLVRSRPRANTSPWLPSLFRGDHQSWFNDPRFDGSFPSRVLPFLYLGNLNHASNVYMLHALGITHVVSVGECALVPPPHHMTPHSSGMGVCHSPGIGPHYIPGKGPSGHGSLWIEEREGRIKVMDIKGVCDDGIDTLEPQLEPICDWIDKARQEGGQVLVHCRVGVSRSATVTIAYVMKHLNLPLVDAYLIVRSRRLSVLIQPNMRLLYNLCGWEIKLAKERAQGDPHKLKKELARTLTWPYLAKEVHGLNEKYLH